MLFRRVFHLCAPLFLTYYLIPQDTWIGFSKQLVLLSILLFVLLIEATRVLKGWVFFGLRDYEKKQVSAYAWAGMGITIAFLFFPLFLVVPIVFGMAWIDPLIGIVRKKRKKWYPFLPGGCYALILFLCLSLLSPFSLPFILLLTMVGTFSALLAEYPELEYIDDDFLMMIIPLVAMTILYHAIQSI